MRYLLSVAALAMVLIALTGCPPSSPPTEETNPPAADEGETSVLDQIEPETKFIEPDVDGESNITGEPAEDSLEDTPFEGVEPEVKDPAIITSEPGNASEGTETPASPPKDGGGDVPLTAPGNPPKTPPKDAAADDETVGDEAKDEPESL